jgi:peptide chain release factor 1
MIRLSGINFFKNKNLIIKTNHATKTNTTIITFRNFMLETTQVKLVNAYDDSLKYIKTLVKERNDLATLINNETEMNKQENRQEMFQRLNQLEQIASTYFKLSKFESDLNDSKEMLNSQSEQDEDDLKDMFQKDIQQLNESVIQTKIELIQSLVKDDPEDKENAYVEISAGVGGNESRIFCSELFEMYRLYSEFKQWTFRPVKVYTDMTGNYRNCVMCS